MKNLGVTWHPNPFTKGVMCMGRHLRLRDPQTGRSLIVYEEPVYYPPVPIRQYPPPAPTQEYPVPAPYEEPWRPPRPRRGGWGGRRRRKAVTWLLGIPWFVLSFALCEINPALTICSWGVLLGWLVFRSFRD